MYNTPGLGRDPKYPGKFGVPDYILNTPQTPAQWWAVALLALLIALPAGVWGMLDDEGSAAQAGYGLLVALTLLNAWFLRNDINETLPFLSFAILSGLVLLVAGAFTSYRAFEDEHWVAGVLTLAAALIGLHNVYRAWQGLLITGVFTEQKVPPDSPYYKPQA
jgi:hypothetical protein